MEDINRTYLLGAGFSKAVADGPVMKELWCHIEKAYKREKSRTDVSPKYKGARIEWFNDLNNFITKLEKEATSRFENCDSYKITTEIKENLEYIFTLIDLILTGPHILFEKAGSQVEPYPAIPFRFTSKSELEGVRNILQTYFYLVFVRLEGNILATKFSKIINSNDNSSHLIAIWF
jgi:predicted transport protein